MALRSEIPRDLELARGRKFLYRTRCAWGNNHLRRRGEDGALMRKVAARSTAAGKTIDTAIDGYRPHEDPLNPAYLSHWESTGRPLRPQQFANILSSGWACRLLGDDFTDVNGTNLAAHVIVPTNNTHDVWHDPSNRFQIQGNALVRNGAPDYTTYIDAGNDEYDLQTRLYVDNTGGYSAGFLVRYKDSLNYIYVRLHSNSAGQVDIVRVKGGVSTVLATNTSWTIAVGWYQFVVSVRRDNIKVYVDGVQYLDHDTFYNALDTKVGPHIWSGCNAQLDNFYCLRPRQFYEDYTDSSNWTLNTWGTPTGQAFAVSGQWGKLTLASSGAGSDAGYSGVLNFSTIAQFPVFRDSVYQFQVGKNKPAHTGTYFSESGIVISNSSSNDISAETDCVIVLVRNAGNQSPRIIFRKIVAGVTTDISFNGLNSDIFSENVRVIIADGQLLIYTAKYGLVVSQPIAYLNPMVYVKMYVRTDDVLTVNGYFRDVAIFPDRQIHIAGETGINDSFDSFDSGAWALFGTSIASQQTIGDDNVMKLTNAGLWAWAGIPYSAGDFEWEGYVRRLNAGNENMNLAFCMSEPSGYGSLGYIVTFNSGATYLGKNNNTAGAGPLVVLATNTGITTAQNEDFTWKIVKHGTRIKVWKNDVLVFDLVDASYSSGCFAFGGNDTLTWGVMSVYWHKISPRGLQTPALLRIDRPMVQNPSFEDWDDLEGLTEDLGSNPNSWSASVSSSGTFTRETDGSDGGYCVQIAVASPQADAYFLHEVWQRSVRLLLNHRYRVSFRYKVINSGGGLIEGYPFIYFKAFNSSAQELTKHMIQIASPDENLLAFDEWLTAEFDFVPGYYFANADRNYITLQVSTEYPDDNNFKPVGDFEVQFDQVLIEDVTGFGVGEEPELEWTNTPITYRGREVDREDPEDWWKAFYTMPMNVIWRIGDDFTWGLLDDTYEDLFTSRVNTNVLPGAEWILVPEWIACDLGAELNVNQVLWYSLWSAGIRSLLLTYGGENYSTHQHKRIMDGLTVYSSETRLYLELEENVLSRFVQVVVLDTDEEGYIATCQQLEIYNLSDESERVSNQDRGAPEVSIAMTRAADRLNPLPDAATAMVTLNNKDQRFTPYNKYSPIYGPYKHTDGLGDIRAGVPVTISMVASRFIAGGDFRYAVRDECYGDGYWVSGGWLDNALNPGFIRLTPPSSPPLPYKVIARPVTVDVDRYSNLQLGVERAYIANPVGVNPNFVWRLGVLIGTDPAAPDATIYFPDDTWKSPTSYLDGSEIVYTEDPATYTLDLAAAGITGEQTVTPFVEFDFVGGFPSAYSFYVMLDHYYLYQIYEDREVDYETLMFLGSIGIDKNKGGSLGVSVDGVAGQATIDAVDFTVPLDQPVPVSELNPLESISAEDTMLQLCYLAGIPKQDTEFDPTGVTFPVVVFRDQTMRENIQQLVQAIGGRFFILRDGRLRYQNVAIARSWTLNDRAEFESGIKSNIDTQSLPGEFFMDNIQWNINHRFTQYMPDGQIYKPWTVNSPDAWRFLSGGDYVVITPASQSTTMQHVRVDSLYNKTASFVLEWDVALIDQGGPFNVWGYTTNVVDYDTTLCAWRIEIRKFYSAIRMRCGGQWLWFGQPAPQNEEVLHAFPAQNDRIRLRVLFNGNDYAIYINDRYYATMQLVEPKLIRWSAFESASHYVDAFNAIALLNGRVGDTNTTGDVWHDVNNRWRLDNNLHKNGTAEDWTAYLDFGCPEWWLTADLYLDRTTARDAGWMLRYIDSNNWIALRVSAVPDPGNVWQIIISTQILARRFGGGVTVIAQFADEYNAYEGSQHLAISVSPFSVRLFMSKYNPVWEYYTLWHQVGFYTFQSSQLGEDLLGSTKLGPYYNGGPNNGASWDDMEIDRGSISLLYAGPPIDYPLPWGGYVYQSSSLIPVSNQGRWYDPAPDDYTGKTVIGLDAAQYAYQQDPGSYPNWGTYLANPKTGYRLGYFTQKFNGIVAPFNDGYYGVLTSPVKDLTANVAGWGIFEAEVSGIGPKWFYAGLFDGVSNVDFYVQVSSDGITWDSWVKVIRGQLIPATVELKRYFRWQARFWRTYAPWIAVGYQEAQYRFYNYWKAHVLSATVNWQISTGVTTNWFRATWDIQKDRDPESEGLEMNAAQYSLGNPEANRVMVLVNRWVEQLITSSGVTTDPFWESSELPVVLNLNEVYVINAEYPYPSKKGSGGSLRHIHVSVNSTVYIVNDGAGDTVCGNATVNFTSGQGVGVITITANAASTTINSLVLDAVCYRPASELYGTERVQAEDTEAQEIYGRVIETEPFDNAFSMSRAIAQDYADAELVRTKQYKETISGVQIPIMPSLSLEHYGVIHNPVLGIYERQVEAMEVTHQGNVSIITAKGVRTQEETVVFSPLSLSPSAAWATHRLEDCASSYILRVRSALTGEEFDIYDTQQYFELYQLVAAGDWISAADDDFRVVNVYDQSGNLQDWEQTTAALQPALVFNAMNGWPEIIYDGTDDVMTIVGYTMANLITAAAGEMAFKFRVDNAFPIGTWGPLVLDTSVQLGIVNTDDTFNNVIAAYNNDGSVDVAVGAVQRNDYNVFGWAHTGGYVGLFIDGALAQSVVSGNTASLAGVFQMGYDASLALYTEMRFTAGFSFSTALTDEERASLTGWIQAN
jgi:hypothetical protein